ncbi:hypothetical protein BJV77DRAFT_1071716 [Russula vinacea]|nr:hypothetical protein BJV77DRAFT_1071716 [Russula vinacea]
MTQETMTELVECNTQLHKTLQGLWSDALTQHKLQQQATLSWNKYFSDHAFDESATTGDALKEWLATPPIPNVKNALRYWFAMAASDHPLAPMAMNFLSVPATSTDVECAFSHGGLTVSKMWHLLSDKSAHAASILGACCELPSAVPCEETMAVFRDKSKRPKGSSSSDVTIVDQ